YRDAVETDQSVAAAIGAEAGGCLRDPRTVLSEALQDVDDEAADSRRAEAGLRNETIAEDQAEAAEPAGEGAGRPTIATLIICLALREGVELFHDAGQETYASFQVNGHLETWPTRSIAFKHWLTRLYFKALRKAAGSQAVADAKAALESEARFDGPEF